MVRLAAFLLLSTATVALAQSSSETMGYLGCYTDARDDRILSGPMTSSADNSPEACKAACEGYPYYGVQWRRECFCGTENDDFALHGESNKCFLPCSGDRKSTCGGVFAMDVYVMDDYSTTDSGTSSTSSGGSSGSVESVCSNGVPGIEASGVCCEASCGQCGGSGCSSVGNGAGSCCTSTIRESGELCGVAPCVL
ncbi:unnamed protein product [Ectocarpus fasciculatus]